MPVLTPADFTHGDWVTVRGTIIQDNVWIDDLPPKEIEKIAQRHNCGSRFCLVGWVRSAFGYPPNPETGAGNPRIVKFLKQFVKNCGGDPEQIQDETAASDFFEGFQQYEGARLSKIDAARAWNQTLVDFGYTEDA